MFPVYLLIGIIKKFLKLEINEENLKKIKYIIRFETRVQFF